MTQPNFWKQVTPVWFDWLRWFLALGAVGFVAEKTDNIGLWIIYGISYICFFMFITTTISDILKIKLIWNETVNKIITLLISIVILALTTVTLHLAINGLLLNQ